MQEIGSLFSERGVWLTAYREMLTPRTVAVAVASVVLFTVAMTIFAPLGSMTLEPLPRFGYWALCTVITFPLCYAVATVALYLARRRSLVEIVPAVVAAVLFEGILCTAVVVTARLLLLPPDAPPLSPVGTYLTVTIVIGVCTFFTQYVVFLRMSFHRSHGAASPAGKRDAKPAAASGPGPAVAGAAAVPGTTAPAASAGPKPPPGAARRPGGAERTTSPPDVRPEPKGHVQAREARPAARRRITASQARLYERLSRAVSHDIIYLKVVDHYVHVHTTGGSCLVLMRFADAVADLGSLGMKVHRSYWVAHRHMLSTVRGEGRMMLRVTGGYHVPISRPAPARRARRPAREVDQALGITAQMK